VTGPGSPSVLTNIVTSIEHHVDWITACIQYLRSTNRRSIEADAGAQDQWAERINRFAGPIQVHPSCNSWYLGANVPGKTRHYMPYTGGLTRYMAKCEAVVAGGYEGFTID
jgi:cyclohexanone monooxygenase